MEAIARNRDDVYLRKIDIVSFDSPVARQLAIKSLPTIWIYEGGLLTAKDQQTVIQKLSALAQ